MTESVHKGRCFCGAVHIAVRGDPLFSGYCHCEDCREWSNAPVTSFITWPYDAVTITQGKEHLAYFGRVEMTPRAWCARCGSHIGAFRDKTDPPHVAICAPMLPTFPFTPTMHLFCSKAVIHVSDDLPKYRDLPETFVMPELDLAGTGELMPGSPSP
ncbi:MAG: GFA family protein [Gammaproteobacteria bacterium]|jgi:hypothetical protein